MDIDEARLPGMDHRGHRRPVLVLGIDQDRRTDRIEIPHVMRDILEVADIFAGIEIDRDQAVGVEIVARAHRAVEIGRGIADHEIDAPRGEIDRRVLPHPAAETLVGIAELLERRFFGRDVAVQVMAGRILGRPDADRVFGDGIEGPEQLAGLGVERLDEAADPVFAAIGADQDLPIDRGRGHRLAVALLGIGDVGLPDHLAGLGIEGDQLGIEGGEIDHVAIDGDAAVVGPAAIDGDRSERMLVVPEFGAGAGIERIDVIEGGGDVHHAIDHDRRGLLRLLDLGLEDPGHVQVPHVHRVDLAVGEVALLGVIPVRHQPVIGILAGPVEHFLAHRGHVGVAGGLLDLIGAEGGGGEGKRRGGEAEREDAAPGASVFSGHVSSLAIACDH